MKKASIISLLLLTFSCTDLQETPFSEQQIKSYYSNDETLLKALVPAYSKLRNYTWAYWNLVQLSSNETATTGLDNGFDFFTRFVSHNFNSRDEDIEISGLQNTISNSAICLRSRFKIILCRIESQRDVMLVVEKKVNIQAPEGRYVNLFRLNYSTYRPSGACRKVFSYFLPILHPSGILENQYSMLF